MSRARVFISYVRAESELLALGLGNSLRSAGLDVWLDSWDLHAGDSLLDSFNRALTECRFALVIVTESYMERPWTRRELGALLAREELGAMRLFVVLHGVDDTYLKQHCPLLADRVALSTRDGIENVARALARILTEARRPDYAIVHTYGDLLALWDRVEGVYLVRRGFVRALVLRNWAVGISASVLRTFKDAARHKSLTTFFFVLQFLWFVGHWLPMMLGATRMGWPLGGLCTSRRRVGARLQAMCAP